MKTRAHVQCSRCDSDQLIELEAPAGKQAKFECRNCGMKFYVNIHGSVGAALSEAVKAAASPIPITPSNAWKCIRSGCQNSKQLNSALCDAHAAAKAAQQAAANAAQQAAVKAAQKIKTKRAKPISVVEAAPRMVIVPED